MIDDNIRFEKYLYCAESKKLYRFQLIKNSIDTTVKTSKTLIFLLVNPKIKKI